MFNEKNALPIISRIRVGQSNNALFEHMSGEILKNALDEIDRNNQAGVGIQKLIAGEYGTGKTQIMSFLMDYSKRKHHVISSFTLGESVRSYKMARFSKQMTTCGDIGKGLIEQTVMSILANYPDHKARETLLEQAKEILDRETFEGADKRFLVMLYQAVMQSLSYGDDEQRIQKKAAQFDRALDALLNDGVVTPLKKAFKYEGALGKLDLGENHMGYVSSAVYLTRLFDLWMTFFIDELENMRGYGYTTTNNFLTFLRHLVDISAKAQSNLFLFATPDIDFSGYPALRDRLVSKPCIRCATWTTHLFFPNPGILLKELVKLYCVTYPDFPDVAVKRLNELAEFLRHEAAEGRSALGNPRIFSRRIVSMMDDLADRVVIDEMTDEEILGYVNNAMGVIFINQQGVIFKDLDQVLKVIPIQEAEETEETEEIKRKRFVEEVPEKEDELEPESHTYDFVPHDLCEEGQVEQEDENPLWDEPEDDSSLWTEDSSDDFYPFEKLDELENDDETQGEPDHEQEDNQEKALVLSHDATFSLIKRGDRAKIQEIIRACSSPLKEEKYTIYLDGRALETVSRHITRVIVNGACGNNDELKLEFKPIPPILVEEDKESKQDKAFPFSEEDEQKDEDTPSSEEENLHQKVKEKRVAAIVNTSLVRQRDGLTSLLSIPFFGGKRQTLITINPELFELSPRADKEGRITSKSLYLEQFDLPMALEGVELYMTANYDKRANANTLFNEGVYMVYLAVLSSLKEAVTKHKQDISCELFKSHYDRIVCDLEEKHDVTIDKTVSRHGMHIFSQDKLLVRLEPMFEFIDEDQ